MYQYAISDFAAKTNKSRLALILKVSRRTIHSYHQTAFLCVEDFLSDYPKLDNQPYTEAPLTQYQAWVMWKIYIWFKIQRLPKKVLEDTLENDPLFQAGFSRIQFDLQFPIYPDQADKYNHYHQPNREEKTHERANLCHAA